MRNDGFIVLASVLVISAVLITIVAAVSGQSFYANKATTQLVDKMQSESTARSCLSITALALINNRIYTTNEPFRIGNTECIMLSLTDANLRHKRIRVRVDINRAVTTLEAVLALSPAKIETITEIP